MEISLFIKILLFWIQMINIKCISLLFTWIISSTWTIVIIDCNISTILIDCNFFLLHNEIIRKRYLLITYCLLYCSIGSLLWDFTILNAISVTNDRISWASVNIHGLENRTIKHKQKNSGNHVISVDVQLGMPPNVQLQLRCLCATSDCT